MELARILAALADPAAYPGHPTDIRCHQTHVSVVFLAGDRAYKIKKPVDFGFLDFRSLDRRQHFCQEEVRLNRRMAPDVYRGVVPITVDSSDRVRVAGCGDVVEWAVEMERLPDDATLQSRIEKQIAGRAEVEALAARVAAFHASAESGPTIAAFGRFDVVAANSRDNFALAAPLIGRAISASVCQRLQALTERHLAQLHSLIDARAARGLPRDTHGDLRLEHVYVFPERPRPHDLAIIDCIEFNERFRYADPVADMAFLVMDLRFCHRDDLARAFADAYFHSSGDSEGRILLHFYTAYRAVVRCKVEGLELAEKEIPDAEKEHALRRAGAHALLALYELEIPGRRPCLVLTAGLPGTGKSTLARGLADESGFHVVRSDAVRKELAGKQEAAAAAFDEGIYSPLWTDRTYAECLRQAERSLFNGERVVVDASFRQEGRRRPFLDLAKRYGVPAFIFLCRASPDVIRSRLERRYGDPSDADWNVYLQAAERWEDATDVTRPFITELAGDRTVPLLAGALDALKKAGLHGN